MGIDKVKDEVDKTIISICEHIYNDEIAIETYTKTIKTLAALIIARASL